MWKLGVAVVVLLGSFGGGYYYGSGQKEIQVVTEKGETQIVEREKVITRIVEVLPDGTKRETIREEESKREETNRTVIVNPTPANREDYRVGVAYWASSTSDVLGSGRGSDGIGFSVSRRLLGPAWVEVSARPIGPKKEVALGVSVQW